MTLEDFKKHFEQFAPLDTPEKLAFCERQYRAHLKHEEEKNFFEPLEESTGEDLLSVYHRDLYARLGYDEIVKDQVLFLSQPSFEPEYILVIDKRNDGYALTYKVMQENYWGLYYDRASSKFILNTSVGQLTGALGNQLFSLIERSFAEVRKAESGYMTLDGVQYNLAMIIDETRQDIFKHSPHEGTAPDKIIQILKAVIRLTTENNLPEVEKEIERLITLAK